MHEGEGPKQSRACAGLRPLGCVGPVVAFVQDSLRLLCVSSTCVSYGVEAVGAYTLYNTTGVCACAVSECRCALCMFDGVDLPTGGSFCSDLHGVTVACWVSCVLGPQLGSPVCCAAEDLLGHRKVCEGLRQS